MCQPKNRIVEGAMLLMVFVALLTACNQQSVHSVPPAQTVRVPQTSPQRTSPPEGSTPTPIPVTPTTEPMPPGLILYESNAGPGWEIWQMDGGGANKRVVVPFDQAAYGFGRYPIWSPDGQHFAYLYAYDQNGKRWDSIRIADRGNPHTYQVGEPARSVVCEWSDQHTLLVYLAYYGLSSGTYDLFTGTYDLSTALMSERIFPADYREYEQYVCSPGCLRVAGFKREERQYFIQDLLTGERTVILQVPESGFVGSGTWQANGKRLAFTYCRLGQDFCDLYTVRADGRDLHRVTDLGKQFNGAGSPEGMANIVWSPDEKWIACNLRLWRESLSYLGVIHMEEGTVINLGIALRGSSKPVWSPDSTKIAFVSNVRFEGGKFADPYEDLDQWDIYTIDVHTKEIRRLTNDEAMEMHIDWR